VRIHPIARFLLAALLVASSSSLFPSSTQAQASPPGRFLGQSEGDFVIKDFRFNSNEVLPQLRLHYATLGTPHRNASGEIDNAVLLLHSSGSDLTELLDSSFSSVLYGPGQPLDLSKFYLIIPDAVGHGKSSKPSDGMRASFPHYGYQDLVVAQHRLVTEKLGVTHLRLVLGLSMGAMHTWLWGERYPGMMDGLFPIGGLPMEIAGRNRLWRHTIVEAIRSDPEWKNGDYERQPQAYSRIAPFIAIMTGNPLRQNEQYPTRAAADAWYERITKSVHERRDANDALYYYQSSSDYDPAPDLEKIRARLLLIDFDDDQINAPQFAALGRAMSRVKYGRYVIIPTGQRGNGEGSNISDAELWLAQLRDLLRSLQP